MKKTLVITPTIRKLDNLKKHLDNFTRYNEKYHALVLDDDNPDLRKFNTELLRGFDTTFIGLDERPKFFKEQNIGEFIDLIPERCHAKISFGLVYATINKDEYDMILLLDDDTAPFTESNFMKEHRDALEMKKSTVVTTEERNWVNVIKDDTLFPRGFPYKERIGNNVKLKEAKNVKVLLNQGLWFGIPDLNAMNYLEYYVKPIKYEFLSGVVAKEKFITVCSMNLSFRPEIMPLLYQLPMKIMEIDRINDIWAGIFAKKILDMKGFDMSFGKPYCNHKKVTRNMFNDIRWELKGVEINEVLSGIVSKFEWKEDSYTNMYKELANFILKNGNILPHPEYIKILCEKMIKWSELMRKFFD